MNEEPLDKNEDDLVLTPGGPRLSHQVRQVKQGEVVIHKTTSDIIAGMESPPPSERKNIVLKKLVLTPGGYRHPSLVHRIASGQAIRRSSGKSSKFNLNTKRTSQLSVPAQGAGVVAALGSGWITNSTWKNNTGQTVSSFTTTWTVPPAPSTQNGQTIFLFNALLDAAQNDILQPVLQWGPSQAGGGAFWSVACWFVDTTGNAFFKGLVQVQPGDILVGIMTLTATAGGLFTYDCVFQGVDGVGLTIQTDTELVVATETLECYSIQQCTDYPNTNQTAMTGIEIKTGAAQAPINWTVEDRVVDCGQHTVIVDNASPNGEVDLAYK